MDKPYSYFSCEIKDGDNIIQLEDCYFVNTYGWLRGGYGSVKMIPYIKSKCLYNKYGKVANYSLDYVVVTDIYVYENNNRVSIMDTLTTKYQEVRKYAGEYYSDLPFPISQINVYED